MTEDMPPATLDVVLAAMTHMQDQLDRFLSANDRIEALQRDMLRRLDRIGAGQAVIAELAAHAHAASIGNGAPLPPDLADNPILEQYLLTQPADRTSTSRAIADWRRVAAAASSGELAGLLLDQYRPSPTDTPEARLLRYQLAAITREELRGRGVTPPAPPPSTRAEDRSADAARRRSAELARLWRAGETTALFGEPELAGALDLFEANERSGRGIPDEQSATELADLHRALGNRLEAGERPTADEEGDGGYDSPRATIEAERPR